MKKHIKTYMDYFGYGDQDMIPCELCGRRAADIHHIVFRSQGGKDNIENLIALCREHHEKAHSHEIPAEFLKKVHDITMSLKEKGYDDKIFNRY